MDKNLTPYQQFQLLKYGNILKVTSPFPFLKIIEEERVYDDEQRKMEAWEQIEFDKLLNS